MLEWAHGKFQDAYESVHSRHTEWVCECLSGHTASFRMPESVRSGHTEWVCECLSGHTEWVCVYLSDLSLEWDSTAVIRVPS